MPAVFLKLREPVPAIFEGLQKMEFSSYISKKPRPKESFHPLGYKKKLTEPEAIGD